MEIFYATIIDCTFQLQEIVHEVCRISGDGLRIVVYRPLAGIEVGEKPPPLPDQGTDSIHSYESLPTKHHKSYIYAWRFVNLVRSKTTKITLFTHRAKCFFMENGPEPDCELCFYDGVKVQKKIDIYIILFYLCIEYANRL